MPSKQYATFALPKTLVARVDDFVAANTWGYRSRAEVLAAAVREFLERRPATQELSQNASASSPKPHSESKAAGPRRSK